MVIAKAHGGFVLALLLGACGGRARSHSVIPLEEPPLEDAGPPVSCAGSLAVEPSVLRSDVTDGWLLLGGERLILVEKAGRIVRIDRCSGDATELATGLGRVSSAVVAGNSVWVASGDDGVELHRVALDDGRSETIPGSPYGSLVTDGASVFLVERPPEGLTVVRIPASGAVSRSTRMFTSEYSLRPLAAGPAGVYFSQDCDCASRLRRLPPDGSALLGIDGTGPDGVTKYYASALVHNDELYLALNPDWIRRLPLQGGEPETLVTSTNARNLSANGDHFCWLEGAYDGTGSVRCTSLGAPSGEWRVVDQLESGRFLGLAVASDAAYWLRPASSDTTLPLELVAALL